MKKGTSHEERFTPQMNQIHWSSLFTLGSGVVRSPRCPLGKPFPFKPAEFARAGSWAVAFGIAMQSLGFTASPRAELQARPDPGIQIVVSRVCPSTQAGCDDHGYQCPGPLQTCWPRVDFAHYGF